MEVVLKLIKGAGFDVVEPYYLYIIDADQEDYLGVNGYKDLVRITTKRPSKANILRTLAYPLINSKPSLRQSIIIIAMKVIEPKLNTIERW